MKVVMSYLQTFTIPQYKISALVSTGMKKLCNLLHLIENYYEEKRLDP